MATDKTRGVRESVSAACAKALENSRKAGGSSCCAPGTSCCTPPVGTAAKTAGYSNEELSRYSEASVSSLGCGNPLVFEGVGPGGRFAISDIVAEEVPERFVYEAAQLRDMVGAASLNTGSNETDLVANIDAITGKVWSAKFRGQK